MLWSLARNRVELSHRELEVLQVAVDTDRGVLSTPVVVDALGWRRVLTSGDGYQPPDGGRRLLRR